MIDDGELKTRIERAGGDADALRLLFEELVTDVGSDEASARWWRAFSAQDATET